METRDPKVLDFPTAIFPLGRMVCQKLKINYCVQGSKSDEESYQTFHILKPESAIPDYVARQKCSQMRQA